MPVILSLTDLHFGYDDDVAAQSARQIALRSLSNSIKALSKEWQPDIICIGGDISWRCRALGYTQATGWITEMMTAFALTPDRILMTPGNHDVDRALSSKYVRPTQWRDAERILRPPLDDIYTRPFHRFIDFANGLAIPPYRIGDDESQLVGQREVNGISFISLNTAWFCQGDGDKGNLWVGQPIVNVLEAKAQFPYPKGPARTVVLMHHPKTWLNPDESHAYGERPNTIDLIAIRSDVILTGHEHGEGRRPDTIAQSSLHFSGGATYAGNDYRNTFCLIRLNTTQASYRTFEYDPRAAERTWRPQEEARSLLWPAGTVNESSSSLDEEAVKTYRAAALLYANGVVEAKSRALRPNGALPNLATISVRVELEGILSNDEQKHRKSVPEVEATTFRQAAEGATRVLLVGDLGSGKSTLVAEFAAQWMRASPGLCIMTPARVLIDRETGHLSWNGPTEFLEVILDFANRQVWPAETPITTEQFTRSTYEKTIIVDGLDEVTLVSAKGILRVLVSLSDNWPCFKVIATGRPTELLGLDYSRWRRCTVLPVNDAAREALFRAEAESDGLESLSAEGIAKASLTSLKAMTMVYSEATTPLFCRLIFGHIGGGTVLRSMTLGDVLVQLARERLGEWSGKDSKNSPWPIFDRYYPVASARLDLFAQLAFLLVGNAAPTDEQVRRHLKTLIPAEPNPAALIEEALLFLNSSGLMIHHEGNFQFPLQSLFEVLCGYGLALRVQSHRTPIPQPTPWRVVAFAATAGRRLGIQSDLRPALRDFVSGTLGNREGIPSSAHVVTEFLDVPMAEDWIAALSKLGRRPLLIGNRSNDWEQNALVIARSVALAGNIGFEWFYNAYFNPIYPFVHAGSVAPDRVFERWSGLVSDTLPVTARKKLARAIRAHLAAETHHASAFVRCCVALCPDAYSPIQRLRSASQLLGHELLGDTARQIFNVAVNQGQAEIVKEALLETVYSGLEWGRYAAICFLSHFADRPPSGVARAILRYVPNIEIDDDPAFRALAGRIGRDACRRLTRWYLSGPDRGQAASAAITLFKAGESRIQLLIPALLGGLHDGGWVPGAEATLSTLVLANPPEALTIMVASTRPADPYGLPRRSTPWWRIFLKYIRQIDGDGSALLAKCIAGVGEFLLARNPEVRQLFKKLTAGSDGASWLSTLRDCLHSQDPATRHGAAMVLLVCDPGTESGALMEVVKAQGSFRLSSWHEWQAFCYSLDLGFGPLTRLKSEMDRFPLESRRFAISLLQAKGLDLSPEQFVAAVKYDLQSRFDEGAQSYADYHRGYDTLLGIFLSDDEGLGRAAARALLSHHNDRLPDEIRAQCELLRDLGNLEWTHALDVPAANLMTDRYDGAAQRLIENGYPQPIIDALRRPSVDKWKDVVWNHVCTNKLHGQDRGVWLLDLMKEEDNLALYIGSASKFFLSDSRLEVGLGQDARLWLGILAEEGVRLDKHQIRELVTTMDPIHREPLVALIARLDEPFPELVSQHGKTRSIHPKVHAKTLGESFDKLRECARTSQLVHDHAELLLEDSLLIGSLDQPQLEELAKVGSNGPLLAACLTLAYGGLPEPSWAIVMLIELDTPRAWNDNSRRFRDTAGTLLRVAELDSDWRMRYIESLASELISRPSEKCTVGAEILALRGYLEQAEVQPILEEFTEARHVGKLTQLLSTWLARLDDLMVWNAVELEVSRGLTKLNSQSWDAEQEMTRDPGPYLVLPLVQWKRMAKTDEISTGVFWRGLRRALVPDQIGPGNLRRLGTLDAIRPLLDAVDLGLLRQAIAAGRSAPDLTVRSLARIFQIGEGTFD